MDRNRSVRNPKFGTDEDFPDGSLARHKLTNEDCIVVKHGNEQVVIRTPDFKERWVYLHELEKITDSSDENK